MILVHQSPEPGTPASLQPIAEKLPQIDFLSDPGGSLYRAFELGKGKLRQIMGFRVWKDGFHAMLQGHRPHRIESDVRQMPGAFLLYRGDVVSAFRAQHSSEYPDLEAMAKALSQRHAPTA